MEEKGSVLNLTWKFPWGIRLKIPCKQLKVQASGRSSTEIIAFGFIIAQRTDQTMGVSGPIQEGYRMRKESQ